MGVIGLGQIAKAFVMRARSFGVRIVVNTRTRDTAFEKQLGIEYTTLDHVLRNSDIVCLFASLTKETRRMIGFRELSLMKPSAFLINIARGELIDQEALLDALQKGRIAGAGLDVFEVEPLFESPLFALDNVVLTPHQAGLTRGGKVGAALRAARNALTVLQGGMPNDAVNLPSSDGRKTQVTIRIRPKPGTIKLPALRSGSIHSDPGMEINFEKPFQARAHWSR